jgi:two-component system LytT family response regulator
MLRILIVDDEHLARQAIRRLLTPRNDTEVVGEADSVATARQAIETTRPDIVFLDIELGSGGDGFKLLESLEKPPVVIFITAYAEYAVDAFAVDAVDYLLKPVEPERLNEALARAERQIALRARPPSTVVELKTPRRTLLAPHADIVMLAADGDFTKVHVAGEQPLMIWRTLSHFETTLPSPPFLRLGRSLIINRDRLRRIETPTRSGCHLVLDGVAEPVELGRAAAQRLRELLGDEPK